VVYGLSSKDNTRVLNFPRGITASVDNVFCKSDLYKLWKNNDFESLIAPIRFDLSQSIRLLLLCEYYQLPDHSLGWFQHPITFYLISALYFRRWGLGFLHSMLKVEINIILICPNLETTTFQWTILGSMITQTVEAHRSLAQRGQCFIPFRHSFCLFWQVRGQRHWLKIIGKRGSNRSWSSSLCSVELG